jgi:hypothetical protein
MLRFRGCGVENRGMGAGETARKNAGLPKGFVGLLRELVGVISVLVGVSVVPNMKRSSDSKSRGDVIVVICTRIKKNTIVRCRSAKKRFKGVPLCREQSGLDGFG